MMQQLWSPFRVGLMNQACHHMKVRLVIAIYPIRIDAGLVQGLNETRHISCIHGFKSKGHGYCHVNLSLLRIGNNNRYFGCATGVQGPDFEYTDSTDGFEQVEDPR